MVEKCKHIFVVESDGLEYSKLFEEFFKSIDCNILLSKTIIKDFVIKDLEE